MESTETTQSRTERYARWVVRRRWLVLLVTLTAALLAGAGLRNLGFIDEYRVFFGPDNPQMLAFDEVEAIYTKNDNIMIVVEPPDGDAFSRETLAAVEELTAEAWKIPFAIRVDSLTNFQHSYAEGEDDLVVEDLVADARALTPTELADKRGVALNEPLVRDRLVPPEAHVAGVNVTLQFPRESQDETARSVAHARELVKRIERDHPGVKTHVTGMAMLNNAFQESAMQDMMTLTPLMYLVIIVVMAVLLRSVSGTLATLAVIAFSVATALGLGGWAGFSLTPPSTAAITMIMTLAVADSVHILVSLLGEMRRGLSKRDAIVESLRLNAEPVFLTSLTTCIGFLSMNFSEVPPLRDLGNIAATGVVAAWILSMTMLPAAMAVLPVRVRQAKPEEARATWVGRLGEFVIARRNVLLWGGALTALALVALVPMNDLNDQFVDYFDETTDFRQASDFAIENLNGIYVIQYSLGAGESGGISNPSYLAKLDEFSNWYRQQAAAAGMSPFHFSRLFKKSTGKSPYQFVLQRRIERAKKLLRNSTRSLADVGGELGFSHQSHFTSAFRKQVGATPGAYRKEVLDRRGSDSSFVA